MPTSVSLWASNGYSRFQGEAKHPCGVLRFFFVAGLPEWCRMPGVALDAWGGVGCLEQRRMPGAALDVRLAAASRGGFGRARLRINCGCASPALERSFAAQGALFGPGGPGLGPAVPQAERLPIPDVSGRCPVLLFWGALPAASIIAPLRAPPPPCAGARTTDSP